MRLGPVGVGCTSGRDSRTTVRSGKISGNGVEYRDLGDVKKRGEANGGKRGEGKPIYEARRNAAIEELRARAAQRFLRPEGNVAKLSN